MSEHLALPEQVHDRVAVDKLHRSAADNPDPALRELSLVHDRGSRWEELHLGLDGQGLERALVESAEGIAAPQELGDVVHQLGQPVISAAASSMVGRIGITRSMPITERMRRICSLEAATARCSAPSLESCASRESNRARTPLESMNSHSVRSTTIPLGSAATAVRSSPRS